MPPIGIEQSAMIENLELLPAELDWHERVAVLVTVHNRAERPMEISVRFWHASELFAFQLVGCVEHTRQVVTNEVIVFAEHDVAELAIQAVMRQRHGEHVDALDGAHSPSPLSLRMLDTTSLNISFAILSLFAIFAVIACSGSAEGAIIARPYMV